MAITPLGVPPDNLPLKIKNGSSNQNHLSKTNMRNITPSTSTKNTKCNKNMSLYPYLNGDKVQVISRVTEKRLVHKTTTDFVSSFPLATNLYKVNSDEFKTIKKENKKVKKSVLTLPTKPAPLPHLCTVSDMNESEYCDHNDKKRIKKRRSVKNIKKVRVREKDHVFYDRGAPYCSQLNIALDSSSTDTKNHKGDCKRHCKKNKPSEKSEKYSTEKNNAHNVWTVLRNMNRFQFRPSPAVSIDSLVTKKQKASPKCTQHKDTRMIETRTEEFSYISSYELDEQDSRTLSRSSSFGRVTVIDRQESFNDIIKHFEDDFPKRKPLFQNSHRNISTNKKHPIKEGANGNLDIKKFNNYQDSRKANAYKTSVHKEENCSNNNKTTEVLKSAKSKKISEHNTPNYIDNYVSFVHSIDSGSSKAELTGIRNIGNAEKTIIRTKTNTQRNNNFKSIHELDLNVNAMKISDLPKNTSCLKTIIPSKAMSPILTRTEIKRRLSRLKTPIVILGKDQLSSEFEVLNYDAPQFYGLDKQVWPFMLDWLDEVKNNKDENTKLRKTVIAKNNPMSLITNLNKSRKEISTIQRISLKNKDHKIKDSNFKVCQKKIEPKIAPLSVLNGTIEENEKSFFQLEDKMLNFLYKKPSKKDMTTGNMYTNNNEIKRIESQFEISNHIPIGPYMVYKDTVDTVSVNTKKTKQNLLHPWAKVKWASDFVDNVIKNIRYGVYYSPDDRKFAYKTSQDLISKPTFARCKLLKKIIKLKDAVNSKGFVSKSNINLKETGIQVGSTSIHISHAVQTNAPTPNITKNLIKKDIDSLYAPIPGFNHTLPALEIKTLNRKQIAIKNCVTNVMVQFDIIVPVKSNKDNIMNKSQHLVPLDITESNTKVFKYRTSIQNAMLPAEVCSLLPKLMNNFKDININANMSLIASEKSNLCLSTISEQNTYNYSIPFRCIGSPCDNILTSPILRRFFGGTFSLSNMKSSYRKTTISTGSIILDSNRFMGLLPRVSILNLLNCNVIRRTLKFPTEKKTETISSIHSLQHNAVATTSKALCIYPVNNKKIIPTCQISGLLSIMWDILKHNNLNMDFKLSSYFDIRKMYNEKRDIKLNMTIKTKGGFEKSLQICVSNNESENNSEIRCLDFPKNYFADEAQDKYNKMLCNKTKRRCHKLHRKCKSTTHLHSGEKSMNTLLSKVKSLEDFLQIIGSKKALVSMFDGYTAKKILNSVTEMKNWISEISPQQALLVLLLINKKDTTNLARFRPILLQGIAVNRITRITELDMEIEVIERENLNKISQHEGISYLPETIENYDNLMEELYWIAKTTASDYQRPFNESSEKLLRSLLEKRKKLNPSYLRVMARYVGLGLLKSPVKK